MNVQFMTYFKGRKCLRKKLLRFLRFLENSQKFFPAKSKVNREPQNSFPAKRSSFAEPQKFIPVKCLFPKQNTMNTKFSMETIRIQGRSTNLEMVSENFASIRQGS